MSTTLSPAEDAGRLPGGATADPAAARAVRVVDLDLDESSGLRSPGGLGVGGPAVGGLGAGGLAAGEPGGRVLALVRLHGHPLGLVTATGAAGDTAALRRALVAAAHRELAVPALSTATPAARPRRVDRARVPAGPSDAGVAAVSVVIATRDRVDALRRCLDSLLRNGHPRYEVIVVDSAPADDAAERLLHDRFPGRVRYLREPVPGLARARNRGLAAARGDLVAFTDDDTLADPGWIAALADVFAADDRIGCVTGLVLPAELDSAALDALERHGGSGGLGDFGGLDFAARTWTLDDRHPGPLLPFAAGRLGSGANMAFRARLLRDFGGFDPATGAGTPAHGGDDLLAFLRVLLAGHALAYAPDAIVWHRPRRTADAPPAQAFRSGAGYGACLAAALVHEPAMLPALLRRLPGGLRYAARRARTSPDPGAADCLGQLPPPVGRRSADPVRAPHPSGPLRSVRLRSGPRRLARLELCGLLYGPFGYLRGRLRRVDSPARPGAAPGGGAR
ncbi:glycosyltransferase [Kitasatospora sp. NPDC093806]|uniref:glycosyltransferase family 2 protein n=1 Tax=Kitasatospora sp. NPDC093806 TaxID=3155075 RepID=UPI003429363F